MVDSERTSSNNEHMPSQQNLKFSKDVSGMSNIVHDDSEDFTHSVVDDLDQRNAQNRSDLRPKHKNYPLEDQLTPTNDERLASLEKQVTSDNYALNTANNNPYQQGVEPMDETLLKEKNQRDIFISEMEDFDAKDAEKNI